MQSESSRTACDDSDLSLKGENVREVGEFHLFVDGHLGIY